MKTPPSQAPINSASYPTEFQQVILEKSQNFIGREFIFTAITDFLHRHKRGYFTIVGVPGSGKSAILAKYVTENYHVIYYNAQIVGKNRAEEFLRDVCTQLIEWLHNFPSTP
ncbi:ATP-binding protein, partial [Brasilonema bromeliae SPC951]|nr:ATP-binding protein [Brasilonema bromeliae SPC951]